MKTRTSSLSYSPSMLNTRVIKPDVKQEPYPKHPKLEMAWLRTQIAVLKTMIWVSRRWHTVRIEVKVNWWWVQLRWKRLWCRHPATYKTSVFRDGRWRYERLCKRCHKLLYVSYQPEPAWEWRR